MPDGHQATSYEQFRGIFTVGAFEEKNLQQTLTLFIKGAVLLFAEPRVMSREG